MSGRKLTYTVSFLLKNSMFVRIIGRQNEFTRERKRYVSYMQKKFIIR